MFRGTKMKIILGSGISALIYAYFNKDYFIIGERIGGQMNAPFELGPRYLHKSSDKIIKFLDELEVEYKNDIIRVGYIDDSGFIESPDQKFREKYYMKSRGVKTLEGFDSSVMNSNKSEFEILRVNFKDMILKLFMKLSDRIYEGKVNKIDLKNKTLEANSKDKELFFKYENLVSTIPLNIFSKISELGLNLESYDMSYCFLKQCPIDLKSFDYVYDCRSSRDYHRITKVDNGFVLDFFGSKNIFEPKSEFKVGENLVILKDSQIVPLKEEVKVNDIKFVGRYGKWDRHIKIENVIEESFK
jgi:hypothetical protein